MRKILIVLILMSSNIMAKSVMDIPVRAIEQSDAFKLTANSLNCREGAGKGYAKVKKLRKDGVYEATKMWDFDDDNGLWMEFYIANDGSTCWARASYKYMRPTLFVQGSLERGDLMDIVTVCRTEEYEFDLEIDLYEGRASLYFSELGSFSEEVLNSEKYSYVNGDEILEFKKSGREVKLNITGDELHYEMKKGGESFSGQCGTYYFRDSEDLFFY